MKLKTLKTWYVHGMYFVNFLQNIVENMAQHFHLVRQLPRNNSLMECYVKYGSTVPSNHTILSSLRQRVDIYPYCLVQTKRVMTNCTGGRWIYADEQDDEGYIYNMDINEYIKKCPFTTMIIYTRAPLRHRSHRLKGWMRAGGVGNTIPLLLQPLTVAMRIIGTRHETHWTII